MAENYSLADIKAATGDSDMNGSWFWIVVLFLFMYGGNGFGGGNTGVASEVQSGFDTSAILGKLDGITQGLNTSGYDTAQLVNGLNTGMMQGFNNTNMGMMQGFSGVTQAMNSGFDGVSAQLSNVMSKIQECCCEMKTQMLQDKYDAVQNQLNLAEMASANAVQTQNILGVLGKYVPNTSSTTTTS